MQKLQVWDTVHQANMRFRPVLPALWMLFRSVYAVFVIQLLLGAAQTYMLLRLIYDITQDKVQAFYFAFGFAGLYVGAAYYLDLYGFGDAFAFTFMMAALYFRQPILVTICILLAACVDERALLNSSYIIIFHQLISNRKYGKYKSNFFPLTNCAWAVLVGGLIYLSVRLFLTYRFQLKTPFGGPSLFFYVYDASKTFGVRLWSGFESFWILVLLMLFVLGYYKEYKLLVVLTALLFITTFTILMQGDHTRTQSYGFPIFLIAMAVLQSKMPKEEIRSVLLIISLLSLIFFPIFY